MLTTTLSPGMQCTVWGRSLLVTENGRGAAVRCSTGCQEEVILRELKAALGLS